MCTLTNGRDEIPIAVYAAAAAAALHSLLYVIVTPPPVPYAVVRSRFVCVDLYLLLFFFIYLQSCTSDWFRVPNFAVLGSRRRVELWTCWRARVSIPVRSLLARDRRRTENRRLCGGGGCALSIIISIFILHAGRYLPCAIMTNPRNDVVCRIHRN